MNDQLILILIDPCDAHTEALVSESEACHIAYEAATDRFYRLQEQNWTHEAAFGTAAGTCPVHINTTLSAWTGCDICNLESAEMLRARREDDQLRADMAYAFSTDWS